MEPEKTSSYSSKHKEYYNRNKEAILEKYREANPYKAFYEKNKERLRQKALDRYYEKKRIAAAAAATIAEPQ